MMNVTDAFDLLKEVATQDANAAVRRAAAVSVKQMSGESVEDGRPLVPVDESAAEGESVDGEDESQEKGLVAGEQPVLEFRDPEPVTKSLAIGIGSMGGFGIAALNVRGRIATKAKGLPWIGIEVGGGWTPPDGFQVTAGPVEKVDGEYEWAIVSGAASVLFYLHRMHYIPLRGGFDIGRGPFGVVGYGFEHLNEEGFFSWGVEVGLLIQPVIEDWIDKIVDCGGATKCISDEPWKLVPSVRFSLHFYLI
jgi:hypothetical protein